MNRTATLYRGVLPSLDSPPDQAIRRPIRKPAGVKPDPAVRTRIPGNLTVDLALDEAAFNRLGRDWDRLMEESDARVFQSYDWLFAWWNHFGRGKGRRLLLLTIRDGPNLVGIAPFFVQETLSGRSVLSRRLRILGCGIPRDRVGFELFSYYPPSDYLDIVAARSHEAEVGLAVAGYLNEEYGFCDELEFENMPEEGILFNHVVPNLNPEIYQSSRRRPETCVRVNVPGSTVEFLRSLAPSANRRMQQARKAFIDPPLGTIETVDTAAALGPAFRTLVDLHQKRWNAIGFPGVFSDDRFLSFQEEIASRFLHKGWLWFRIAMYNGEPVAARLGFRHGGCMYDYLAGFDQSLPGARRRPGLALLYAMIEDACRNGDRVVDLLRGTESYKYEFASTPLRLWTITLRDRSESSSFRAWAARAVRRRDSLTHALRKELHLLKIQYGVRGPGFFLPSYGSFLYRRFMARFSGITGPKPGDGKLTTGKV